MRIGRTLPPAAAPLCGADFWHGAAGLCAPARALRAREEEMRRHFGVGDVFLVSSGTAALAVTLAALRSLSSRTEVVIPAYTCFSVPAAVVKAGLRPVLCDIDPASFDFDRGLLEQALGPKTLCVVAHHLFGVPSDVAAVRALCAPRGIFVVEDAAQAMGIEDRGRKLGTLGDAGIFSLGRGKAITCGSGGVVVTSRPDVAAALAAQYRRMAAPCSAAALGDLLSLALMALFIRPRLYWIPAALPFLRLGETVYPRDVRVARLSGVKAGFLHGWRSRLERANRARAEAAAAIAERLPFPLPQGRAHPYLRLPLVVSSREERERLQRLSRERGLGLGAGYPAPVNEIPELRRVFAGRRFPSAKAVAERLLTIPTHHWLSDRDRRAIADGVGATGLLRPSGAWPKAS